MPKIKVKTHYVGMNGTSGCIPDSFRAYHSLSDAVDSLSDLLELTKGQRKELHSSGYVACTPEQGADYAEISECDCPAPWEHSERDDDSKWQD